MINWKKISMANPLVSGAAAAGGKARAPGLRTPSRGPGRRARRGGAARAAPGYFLNTGLPWARLAGSIVTSSPFCHCIT